MELPRAVEVVSFATEAGWLGPRSAVWREQVAALRGRDAVTPEAVTTLAAAVEVVLAAGGTEGSLPGGTIEARDTVPVRSRVEELEADRALLESTGRYRLDAVLGKGGMGRVYRAFDAELERPVAIKVLFAGASDDDRVRFVREARAQAGVDHAHVCRVWEAGEIEGWPYISMQLVEGRKLSDLATVGSLEEIVQVFRRIALGLHAAHRRGLVHRDVKPSNVLVVPDEDGGWHPYLMDFGIAHQVAAPGLTVTGKVVGTPWYMAPEQVAPTGRVDRRADVYGLGVTLYQLLSGELPFEGESAIEVLLRIVGESPRPLDSVAPALPADLVTITMKCLERDPGRRYQSARELAEDLGRYLEGEPVQARPPSLVYRVAKAVTRHRTVLLVAVLGLAAASVFGLLALRERRAAEARARLAQRFGGEAERMEWALRAVYELPPHDTSDSRRRIAERLDELEGEIDAAGALALGPGHLALGRGHFVLGDIERAATHLERAWEAGSRGAEVAYALGRIHLARWSRARQRARAVDEEDARSAALLEAERRHGRPALEFLQRSHGSRLAPSAFLRAQVLLLEERWDEAMTAAAAVAETEPWLYEAHLLAGEAALEAGRRAGLAEIGEARRAFTLATRAGSSDPATWEALCRLEVYELEAVAGGAATRVESRFEAAIDACDRALEVAPDAVGAIVPRTEATVVWAGILRDRGEDPRGLIDAAEPLARRAAEGRPGEAAGHFALGLLLGHRAQVLRNLGEDPFADLEAAAEALTRARDAAPWDLALLLELGTLRTEEAWLRFEVGQEFETPYRSAIELLSTAAERAPDEYGPWHALGRVRSDLASALIMRGGTPSDLLAAAADSLTRAIGIRSDAVRAYNSLAVVRLRECDVAIALDRDPRPPLLAGLEALDRAIEIRPDYANAHLNRAVILRALGSAELDQGRDPWPYLERSVASFERGLEINPNIFFAPLEAGYAYQIGAGWEISQGRDPTAALASARRLADRSLAVVPEDFMGRKVRGETNLVEARWRWHETEREDAVRSLLEEARSDLLRGAGSNPEYIHLWLLQAEVAILAVELDAAAGREVETELARGLEALERARQLDPGHLTALRDEGQLLLAASRGSASPMREARARDAVRAFEALVASRATAAGKIAADLDAARALAGLPAGDS